jgi:phosphoribosylformylglycinamidine cyclo-ligase
VNDVLTSGAKPLFFLDYIASSKLNFDIVKDIIKGLANRCREMGIVLAGGETAEMPGVYYDGKYELAGTIGGFVERENIVDGSKISEGDVLIGLLSNGLHTNGYSLARKVLFEKNNYSCNDFVPEINGKLGDILLAPHKEYASSVLPLVEKKIVHGIAHITGGGFSGNIPRVLPKGLGVEIDKNSWDALPIFKLIQKLGKVPEDEMYCTFNMGIGLVLIVAEESSEYVLQQLKRSNEKHYIIGKVVKGKGVSYVDG